ncbi:MAG: undecaprenyldiphospho-muramoylpentapeptide beta-N-acetylglucosaminyltransferase [Deltaproteobacteria bacterium]|nr:undecaprenyldiphospho-muramoylpentapeptide beta-N-acetylglucosaminyltransferase [Deltaproteobacteria bacterium]
MSDTREIRLIVAGGGTGGHLFPGIAVAEALRELRPGLKALFAGTNKPFEERAVSAAGFEHVGLDVEGFLARGGLDKARAGVKLAAATARAVRRTSRFDPHLILGVGGYASVPWLFAGRLLGKRVAVQEQNVVPGRANSLGAKAAGRIYVSFPRSAQYFPGREVRPLGNPVRPSLVKQFERTRRPADRPFTVLVLGGSQGARGINEAVAGCLVELADPASVRFVHQTGEDFEDTGKKYLAAHPGGGEAAAFFTDMGRRYAEAHLVVCRAGATTVAELTALGKAAIFVPFPFAANNHQEQNARFLEESGAAMVILEKDLTAKTLALVIEELKADPARIADMEQKAKNLGRPDAAKELAADLVSWISEE